MPQAKTENLKNVNVTKELPLKLMDKHSIAIEGHKLISKNLSQTNRNMFTKNTCRPRNYKANKQCATTFVKLGGTNLLQIFFNTKTSSHKQAQSSIDLKLNHRNIG